MRATEVRPTNTTRASRRAWCVFAIMFALMVLDHVDRQIVASMFPLLKARWGLSDRELGALVSVVAVTVAIGTIPLSIVADRCGHLRSLFWMAVVWSGATIACAFATRYGELLFARAIIGVGEAAYGSVGCALLALLFPERIRSTVLAAFLVAGLIGSVVGVMMGGVVVQQWGWESGFVVAGLPGLVLAVALIMAGRGTVPATTYTASGHHRLWPATAAVFSAFVRARSAPPACIAVNALVAPHARVSLNLAALLDSRRIVLHIEGDAKWAVYQRARTPGAPAELPIRAILQQKEVPVDVYWSP